MLEINQKKTMKLIINILLFVLGFFIMLFPNSFQLLTAGLLVGINILIFLVYRRLIIEKYFIYAWLILSVLFAFFIGISNLEFQFKGELVLKYIIFPLLWLNLFTYIKANFSIEYFSKTLFNFSVLAFFSVIILYILLLNGYDYAGYLIVAPNIDSDYGLGFTLHVYGNLIFFAAGLFIVPNIYKNKLLAFFYVLLFVVVAVISGRTALILSLLIGFMFLIFRYIYTGKFAMLFSFLLSFIVILILINMYAASSLNYNVIEFLQAGSLEKIKGLGGEERTAQTALMIDQVARSPWGVGFTNIGISRNEVRDFQYEVLLLATVVRFGIFGFGLILLSLFPVFRNLATFTQLSLLKRFYLVGFLSIIFFSITNPYLESFNFQWMFFCPLVFLSEFEK